MTIEQTTVFMILLAALALFVWGRWRYDIVSLGALLAVFLAGLVPAAEIFLGFGHPAVITVAAVLVISRGLLNAGVVDALSRYLARAGTRLTMQVVTLTAIVALCSGFMNNVGALALLMPVAIGMSRQSGRSPSLLLMPLAFGSLLGGLITLIGTPPNIIIATYRAETGAAPFGMFAFTPVGLAVTIAGVMFIALIGWRLAPHRQAGTASEELFRIEEYITEVIVPETAETVGKTVYQLTSEMAKDMDAVVVGLVRGERHIPAPSWYDIIQANDILLIQANSDDLQMLLDGLGLELAANQTTHREALESEKVRIIEAVVTPQSIMPGQTAISLRLRNNVGINLLAVARLGQRLKSRLGRLQFAVGDILLLQGKEDEIKDVLAKLGCLPLAERDIALFRP
jgi:di/tricarboxylate transporter